MNLLSKSKGMTSLIIILMLITLATYVFFQDATGLLVGEVETLATCDYTCDSIECVNGNVSNANSVICLTGDISGNNIIIGADNVTLDCQGYTIIGDDTGDGILITDYNYSTIKNCVIPDHYYAIHLEDSSYNNLINNYITGGGQADIRLFNASYHNTLINNTANSAIEYGIWIDAFNPAQTNNTLINNTMNSNGGAGIRLGGASNNTLINNTANSNDGMDEGYGIYVDSCSNNTLINNSVDSNNDGIFLRVWGFPEMDNNNLTGNIASNNDRGINIVGSGILHNATGNIVENNILYSNFYGIILSLAQYNILVNNNVSYNYEGIRLSNSDYNNLTNNIAEANNYDGIRLQVQSDYNIFTNNTANFNTVGLNIQSSSNNIFIDNNVSFNTEWDLFSSGNSENNTFYNLTMNNTLASFVAIDLAIKPAEIPTDVPYGYAAIPQNLNVTWINSNSSINLNISYTEDDVQYSGVSEDSIKMWRFNGTWNEINDSIVIPVKRYVSSVNPITFFSIFSPLGVFNDTQIYLFELDPANTTVGHDIEISTDIINSGPETMEGLKLFFYLDGDYWMDSNVSIPDLAPDETYSYTITEAITEVGEHNISVFLNSTTPDLNMTNNYNSSIVILRSIPGGGASTENPAQAPPVAQAPTMTRDTIATFPRFRVSFLNCSLKDKTFNIPPEGATVVLQGSLDDKSQPTPGTAAVLLYPSNISANETKPMYISKIQCIEPEQYAIVHCNQSIIASYEVDVTADLSYLCINYEGTGITPESVTINLNEAGEWKPVTITNVLHNVEKSIICGNITGHTPYMVSGFVPKPEIVSAMEAIDALEKAIVDNCPAEVCAEAEMLLEQARVAYEICDYSRALALANQGRALFAKKLSWIVPVLIVLFVLDASLVYYRKKLLGKRKTIPRNVETIKVSKKSKKRKTKK